MRTLLCAGALVLLTASSALAQTEPPKRILMSWGYVDFSNNEVSIVTTVDDPPKIRLASPYGMIGGVSFNHVRSDGVQEEMVLIQGKQDERVRCDPSDLSAEITVHVRDGRLNGDAAMVKVMQLRHDSVWILGMPVPLADPVCSTRGNRTRKED